MSLRLFAAVDVPEDARAELAGAVRRLRHSLQRAGLEDALRWVAVENLHLTLRFLGNIADDAAPSVIAAMQEPLACGPGALELAGLGTFPPRGRPRVLHVAVSRGTDLLRTLRDAVDDRLSPLCRWEPETRPFAPHLTLARGRDAAKFNPVDLSRLIQDAGWPPVAFEV